MLSNIGISLNGTIYCGRTFDFIGGIQWGYISISTDDGLSWYDKGSGLYEEHIASHQIAFYDHNIVTAGLYGCGAGCGSSPVISISTNDGQIWSGSSGPSRVELIPQAPKALAWNNARIFYAGISGDPGNYTCGGLFMSSDSGSTWIEIYWKWVERFGFNPRQPEDILALNSGDILVGTSGEGIYFYSPNGDSLGTFNDGLTNLSVHTLALDSLGYVYAGTDSGVFRRAIPSILRTELTLNQNWNLVSVPRIQNSYLINHIFPSSISDAYYYNNGYEQKDTLQQHTGYWLKFPYAHNIYMAGTTIECDTFEVTAGWNLIGSITNPITTTSIASEPGGIVTSQFYGYNINYFVTSTIEPGKGYWVKVEQPGQLILSSNTKLLSSNRIKIIPNSEQPPPPPNSENPDTESQIPTRFALAQNYPNPFNPATTINYQLPVGRFAESSGRDNVSTYKVSLKVFNVLGQEVATLVNEEQSAGYKSVKFDGTNLPSGIYFYRLTAGRYVETKKLLLLK